jgi:tetratricopeptide (TPR) repeat protein
MEAMLSHPSPALFENMGHTYSSLGMYDLALKYFTKSAEISNVNGGVLLGMALVKERIGDTDGGLQDALSALEWYASRFSRKGNISSLEAKCSTSIAKMYLNLKQWENVLTYSDRAIDVFTRTCGFESPLMTAPLRAKADALLAMNNLGTAEKLYCKTLEVEAKKDSLDFLAIMQLINIIVGLAQTNGEPRETYKPLLLRVIKGVDAAKKKVPHDGNLGALLKSVAELAIYANQLSTAKKGLQEAILLFRTETSMDCLGLIQQCEEVISLIESLPQ